MLAVLNSCEATTKLTNSDPNKHLPPPNLPPQRLNSAHQFIPGDYSLLDQKLDQRRDLKHVGDHYFISGDDFFGVEWSGRQFPLSHSSDFGTSKS